MITLSWTMAARFEKCPELARAWKYKEVTQVLDERPFLMGRVVHAAMDRYIQMHGLRPLPDLYVESWPIEEADSIVRWKSPTDRDEVYRTGWKVCEQLQEDIGTLELMKLHLIPEEKFSVQVADGVRMFAQADVIALHPSEPVAYMVELKSGSSYDSKQTDWYAATLARRWRADGQPPRRLFSCALLPAQTPRWKVREITEEKMQAQVDRAKRIGTAMERMEFQPKPQSYCSYCEHRAKCPATPDTVTSVRLGV